MCHINILVIIIFIIIIIIIIIIMKSGIWIFNHFKIGLF